MAVAEDNGDHVGVAQYAQQVMYFILWVSHNQVSYCYVDHCVMRRLCKHLSLLGLTRSKSHLLIQLVISLQLWRPLPVENTQPPQPARFCLMLSYNVCLPLTFLIRDTVKYDTSLSTYADVNLVFLECACQYPHAGSSLS